MDTLLPIDLSIVRCSDLFFPLPHSPSLPPPPEVLLHQCSATINSSLQISSKLPEQTSMLAPAPGHTVHTHTRSHKHIPPQIQTHPPQDHCPTLWRLLHRHLPPDLNRNTDWASLCVWPNNCWHKDMPYNSAAASKMKAAAVNLLNDRLLMSLSTLVYFFVFLICSQWSFMETYKLTRLNKHMLGYCLHR